LSDSERTAIRNRLDQIEEEITFSRGHGAGDFGCLRWPATAAAPQAQAEAR